MSDDIDTLIRQLDERRAFLQQLIKSIRSAKTETGWDPIAVTKTLGVAAESSLLPADVRPSVVEARARAEDASSVALLELENDIRDLCESRGWRVDGQWPTLIVQTAVDVKVDPEQRTVAVSGRRLNGTTRRTIERAIEEQVTELFPRGFDPRKFIAQLADAYDEASARKGGEIPILDVYRALVIKSQPARFWRDARRMGFAEISSDQFRARVSAALEANITTAPDGRELRLLPPIDPKNALFLYQPAELRFGFVGRIEFVVPGRGEE